MGYRLLLLLLIFASQTLFAKNIAVKISGLEKEKELSANVNALTSSINIDKAANDFIIRREFRTSIRKALRAKGYYEPEIEFDFSQMRAAKDPAILINIKPGPPILISELNINFSGGAKTDPDYLKLLRNLPKISSILDHGIYEGFKGNITSLALDKGYFDGEVTRGELGVSLSRHLALWNIDFDSGERYKFGDVIFSDMQIRKDYLQNMIPFSKGEYYTASSLAELSRRLSSTQWFSSVIVSPEFSRAQNDKTLPISAMLTPRKKNSMEVGVGYSTDIGPRLKMKWKRHWVNSRGQSYELAGSFSKPEQIIDFGYKIPLRKNALEHYYMLQAGFKREDLNDTESTTSTINLARHWDFAKSWQRVLSLRWSYDEFTQGDVTDSVMLLYPGVSIKRIRQRGGMMPYWGDSQYYSIDYSNGIIGSQVDFMVFQARAAVIRSYQHKHRFLAKGNFGWIETGKFERVPPSLRFFAGGDNSLRGYKYRNLSPKNEQGKLTGASRLATSSFEYQYNFAGKWWGAAFVDVGQAVHDFSVKGLKKGAGVGIRWESPIGPIKVDVAVPIGDKDKSGMQLYISLGPEL